MTDLDILDDVLDLLFFAGIALIGYGAFYVALLAPWGGLIRKPVACSFAFSALVLVGTLAAVGYAFFVSRHGPDGGWWPVAAVVYSSALAFALSAVVGLVKLVSHRFGTSDP